jgi:isopropylmalate/homocitrate/citramalate synthase
MRFVQQWLCFLGLEYLRIEQALEEVALGLYVRQDHYDNQTQINLEETKQTSDLIARFAGVEVS